jgi:hypothetical protein
VWLEGLGKFKKIASSGIEPMTFGFVLFESISTFRVLFSENVVPIACQ